MFWIPIMMAASALMKNQQDHAQEERDKYIESAKARYSPWTGIKPGQVHYAQPANNMMQAGGSYLAYKQGQDRNAALNQLLAGKAGGAGGADSGTETGLSAVADPGQQIGNDQTGNILDQIMKGGGNKSIWASIMGGDGPETQPTPILGGGITSLYS